MLKICAHHIHIVAGDLLELSYHNEQFTEPVKCVQVKKKEHVHVPFE